MEVRAQLYYLCADVHEIATKSTDYVEKRIHYLFHRHDTGLTKYFVYTDTRLYELESSTKILVLI